MSTGKVEARYTLNSRFFISGHHMGLIRVENVLNVTTAFKYSHMLLRPQRCTQTLTYWRRRFSFMVLRRFLSALSRTVGGANFFLDYSHESAVFRISFSRNNSCWSLSLTLPASYSNIRRNPLIFLTKLSVNWFLQTLISALMSPQLCI